MQRLTTYLFALGCLFIGMQSYSQSIKRKTVQGTWKLDSILYDNIKAYATVKVFGDVDAGCMVNSQWVFYGNYDGTITTPMAEGCPTNAQKIVWSTITKPEGNYFGIKPLLEGQKGKSITKGFQMSIESIDDKSMVWNETVDLDYKKSKLTYYFTKISKKAK
ncbi:hypothetical protein [Solitalea koreensis]|uniref:Lipocalin-like domain-containing protein n=1 Tax=Solitalea koreensis TaxID=543615 RepID=A0A521ACP7_9SPHI|nr:hypothetical protein [Solitalea koreensis]SMO32556.1 hypothetical protein SAMN06265350_10157 [Solitalea koreensis]